MARLRVPLLALILSGCATYTPHDPKSYCIERHLAPRIRPQTSCAGSELDASCKAGAVIEFYWKCDHWSSW